jgi:hypothetical protein
MRIYKLAGQGSRAVFALADAWTVGSNPTLEMDV